MIKLRDFREEDKAFIYHWPVYPPDSIELDYAVRKGGWIDQYSTRIKDKIYCATDGSELIGFTIIHLTVEGDAEFLIALKGDKLGQGYGRDIAILTLKRFFQEYNHEKITLVVRKNNHRARKLYEKIGFANRGECIRTVNGSDVEFFMMELLRNTFHRTGVVLNVDAKHR